MFLITVLKIYDYSGIRTCGLVESPVPTYNMEEEGLSKSLKKTVPCLESHKVKRPTFKHRSRHADGMKKKMR